MFVLEWREFPLKPYLAGNKQLDGISHLPVVEIALVTLDAFFRRLQQEKTCNSAHEQTSLSNEPIDSFLRHLEVGRSKELPVPTHMSLGGSR